MSPIVERPDGGTASGNQSRPWLTRIDTVLGAIVEIPVAVLVLIEIALLLAGVIARYVVHRPITWSDELASILFLWLAMLGSVVALRRNEHMRMTALVARVSPPTRAFLEALASAAALALLVLLAVPAVEYAYEESFVTTRSLEISAAWRAAALPVGIGFMLIFGVLRLVQTRSYANAAASFGLIAILILGFSLASPWLQTLGNINLLIFFVGVVAACVFAGVPIAFAFGLSIFGYLALITRTPQLVLVGRIDEGMSHIILLSVPLFVFLGALIEMTGMARAMVAFLASLLGHIRGGLHYVLIGAMYLVSGISGSKAADMADEGAWCQAWRSRGAAVRNRGSDRDSPSESRSHHRGLGYGCLDRGSIYRRPYASRRLGDHAGSGCLVAPSQG